MRRSSGIASRDAMAALAPRLHSALPHFCAMQHSFGVSGHTRVYNHARRQTTRIWNGVFRAHASLYNSRQRAAPCR